MHSNNNPLLQLNDPFEPQREQLQKVQDEAIELQRLCYEVFHMQKDGVKLYEMLTKKYLMTTQWAPNHPQATNLALYWEGFKEGIRGLHDQGSVHKNRIAHGGVR
jgi:hypothetical protein